jgi:hypothetical protein
MINGLDKNNLLKELANDAKGIVAAVTAKPKD